MKRNVALVWTWREKKKQGYVSKFTWDMRWVEFLDGFFSTKVFQNRWYLDFFLTFLTFDFDLMLAHRLLETVTYSPGRFLRLPRRNWSGVINKILQLFLFRVANNVSPKK